MGSAASCDSSMPKELFTPSPTGRSWKKLATPSATYEGMLEPKSLKTDLMSSVKPRRVLDGTSRTDEGVGRGCGAAAAAAPGWA